MILKKLALWALLGCILPFSSWGASTLPLGLKYESDPISAGTTEFKSWDQKLEKLGFVKLQVNGEYFPVLKLDWLDRLYLNQKNGSFVMIKGNIHPTRNVNAGALYRVNNDYLVHLQAGQNHFRHALFFVGMKSDEVSKISSILSGTKTETTAGNIRTEALNSLVFVKRAFADDEPGCFQESKKQTYRTDVEGIGVLKGAWECAKSAGSGIWDATGGGAIDLAQGGYKLLTTNPAETFNAMKEEFTKISAMVSHIGKSLESMAFGFATLPSEAKVKITCNLLGLIGTGAVTNFFTGGAATPWMLRLVADAVYNVGTVLKSEKVMEAYSKIYKAAGKIEVPPAIEKYISASRELERAQSSMISAQQSLRQVHKLLESAQPGMGGRYGQAAQDYRYGLVAEARALEKRIEDAKARISNLEKNLKETESAAMAYQAAQAAGKSLTLGNVACKTNQQLTKNASDYALIGGGVVVTLPYNVGEPSKKEKTGAQ